MLLILSMALLPLGMMALLASRDSAARTHYQHEAETRVAAGASSRQLEDMFSRMGLALRGIADEVARNEDADKSCAERLNETGWLRQNITDFALFTPDGQRICTTGGAILPEKEKSILPGTIISRIDKTHSALRLTVAAHRSSYIAVASIPVDKLAAIAHPDGIGNAYTLQLIQGDRQLQLAEPLPGSPIDNIITIRAPLLGGQLTSEMRIPSSRVTASEILLVLLPILMWLAGALIGWIVVDRLLLRPLAELQRAIMNFQIGGTGPLVIPKLNTPAREIRDLSDAFRQVTTELQGHDAEMASALDRQRLLTREVHHRVKNNLQVVSSLINLHARGAPSNDAAEAYAAIQRRVDALAVVLRNHYAELEENRGVSLRALISELASNLRATASETSRLLITLNLAPLSASQDVAVPVAFMITELVELVMMCKPGEIISIVLEPTAQRDRALLSIAAPALTEASCQTGDAVDRFRRVIGGLARQLRSNLTFDERDGIYSIEIAIVPEGEKLA